MRLNPNNVATLAHGQRLAPGMLRVVTQHSPRFVDREHGLEFTKTRVNWNIGKRFGSELAARLAHERIGSGDRDDVASRNLRLQTESAGLRQKC